MGSAPWEIDLEVLMERRLGAWSNRHAREGRWRRCIKIAVSQLGAVKSVEARKRG